MSLNQSEAEYARQLFAKRTEEIRAKYADQSWPRLAYFVHGEAKGDIRDLLEEIDYLRCRVASKSKPEASE